jgi:hypothetical protein
LNWAKKNLTKEEVNKLLLITDNAGRMVLHVAAEMGIVGGLQEILNWAKENLTKEEVIKLFLITNNTGRTVFH